MHPPGPPGASTEPTAPAGYRLIRPLGRGGMGEVYLAEDVRLGRKVALKFLLGDKTHDQAARRRLVREAQAAAALDHPCICTVYETGETPDGHAFIAMQYVEGEPLANVLQRGPLPVRTALELCAHLADALGAAHRQGIVHRDLKPSNVIVQPSGRPKLLDLGIAKIVLGPPAGAETSTGSDVTGPGSLPGTAAYMSPEQVQQRPIDGRCDLFSLGALLFECLTGRRAFDGSTTFETLANVLHVHPPAPSAVRSELTAAHDELCRRLLAKDPADRFQSADEVVGAIRLLASDSARTTASGQASVADAVVRARLRWWSRWPTLFAIAVVLTALTAAGAWFWASSRALPPVPVEAARWYERGADAIREGAYFSGLQALDEAIRRYPGLALAYARRAEAHAELDDENAAQNQLLMVSQLVPNESRLPRIERLRVQAVRALVMRDVDGAVALYRQLVDLISDESRAWLDLGRAQEAAGLRLAATDSYRKAIEQEKDYAAAHLRLASALGLELKRVEALAAFAEAERLYRAASNQEGEAEVRLRRGMLFDALIEPKLARRDLERARSLATNSGAVYQQVRIELALSSVTASEGRFDDAQRIARAAVERASEHGLETVAADGLVDLAALLQTEDPDEAAALAEQAIGLARRRGARRTESRARLQLAAIRHGQDRHADALALVESQLPFLSANRYRRFELYGLSIKSRALQSLDRLEEARENSANVLSMAETVSDDAQVALAAANLASIGTALGRYPDALRLRERVEEIRTRQGDAEALPYDMANRADVLIRLGRREDADRVLASLEAGIAGQNPAYVRLARRAAFLRALYFATALQCDDAARLVDRIGRDGAIADSAGALAPALGAFCDARVGAREPRQLQMAPLADASLRRERHYWLAAAALERDDVSTAFTEAARGLALLGTLANDELRWRLAAVGGLAARERGDDKATAEMRASARASLDRLKSTWTRDIRSYLQRADLDHLRKRSGL